MTRTRQLFALPEMLLLLYAFPSLIRGVKNTWRKHKDTAFPVLVFAFGVMAVYTTATTNAGAMFRWRMQGLPFFLMVGSYGIYLKQRGGLFRIMEKIS